MRVALATGRPAEAVVEAPFHWTALTFLHVFERDRTEARQRRLTRRGEAIYLASLVNLAVCEPERLADERRALLDEAGLLPSADTARAAASRVLTQAAAFGWLAETTAAPTAPPTEAVP